MGTVGGMRTPLTFQRVLIALAVGLFLVAAAVDVGWITSSHQGLFVALGLASFAGGHL